MPFYINREVVKSLMNSERWSNVSVVVRRTIPEWDKYNSTGLFFEILRNSIFFIIREV